MTDFERQQLIEAHRSELDWMIRGYRGLADALERDISHVRITPDGQRLSADVWENNEWKTLGKLLDLDGLNDTLMLLHNLEEDTTAEKLHGEAGRMIKTYLILIGLATRRQTITYGDLARQIGVANQYKPHLTNAARFCEDNGHPDITTIVVRSDTGRPAEESHDPATWPATRDEVFNYRWLDYPPPTAE